MCAVPMGAEEHMGLTGTGATIESCPVGAGKGAKSLPGKLSLQPLVDCFDRGGFTF